MSNSALSLEQQFTHHTFCQATQSLNHEEAIEIACELHRQMLLKENAFKQIMANFFGSSAALPS